MTTHRPIGGLNNLLGGLQLFVVLSSQTPLFADAFATTLSPPVPFPPLIVGTPLVRVHDIQQRTTGNNREDGSDLDDIAVSFSQSSGGGGDDVDIDITSIKHFGHGLYEVQYTPNISGHYDAAITVGEADISTDLSAGLVVLPARASAIHSRLTANLLATEGIEEDITVRAVDRFGNKLRSSLPELQDTFVVTIDGVPHKCSGLASGADVSFDAELEYDSDEDDGGGLYRASYTPSLAGTHKVSARLRSSGGLLATYYKTTDFTQEVLDDSGQWCQPDIVACDSTRLDSDLTFDWGFASPLASSGQDFPIDSFSVRWVGELRVPSTDEYTFSITLNGEARLVIGDTTVIDTITTPSPSKTITGATAIELHDSTFNPITIEYVHYTDEALFQLKWSCWGSPQRQPIPSTALYYTRHVGSASNLPEGEDYRPSPVPVEVAPGAIDVTSMAIISDTDYEDDNESNGLTSCAATMDCSFIVQTKDSAGNHRYNDGTDPAFEVSMVGTGGWAAQGRVNDDLSYSSEPLSVSALTVSAVDWEFLDNVEVTHGATFIATSRSLLNDLDRGDTLILTGQMYNMPSSGGIFDASTVPLDNPVLGPSMSSVALYKASSDCNTGKHIVQYTPVIRGHYEIDIKLPPIPQVQRVETLVSSDSALSGSFTLAFRSPDDGVLHTTSDIPYTADATNLKGALAALPNLAIHGGGGAEIQVDVNEYTCIVDGDATSGCSWDVTFVASDGDATDIDMVMPSWDNLGGDEASVSVRELKEGAPAQSIDGFPRTINVVPNDIDPLWSTAHGPGLAAATAGIEAEFTVQAKDGAGNNQLTSVDNPDDLLLVTVVPEEDDSNGATIIVGAVTAESEGSYSVRYTPTQSGYHTIRVEMKSIDGDGNNDIPEEISGSPFRTLVNPAEPSASHSAASDSPGILHHEGLSKGVYNSITHFTIQLRDQYDNKVSAGPLPEIQIIEMRSTTRLGGTFDIGYNNNNKITLPAGSGIANVERAIQSLPDVGAVTVGTDAAKDAVPDDGITGSSKTVGVTRGLDTVTPSQRLDDVFQVGDWIRIGDQDAGPVFTILAMSTAAPFTITLSSTYTGESSPSAAIFGRSLSTGDGQYGFQYIVSFEPTLGDMVALDIDGTNLVGDDVSIDITACNNSDDAESSGCPSSPHWNTQSQAGRSGQEFVIELAGPEHVQGQVTYVADGRYEATYVAPRVGEYHLNVRTANAGGLKGSYFNNRWLYGSAITERIDESIDFVWTDADPITKAGKDFVSVRWTGYIKPAYSELYTFRIRVNDGARLWVGDSLIIDEFDSVVDEDESPSSLLYNEYVCNTTVAMKAGRLTTIKIEYQERRGAASLQLEWMSQSQPWSVIDSHRLYYFGNHVDVSPYTVHTQAIVPTEPTDCRLIVTGASSVRVAWMGPNDDGGEDVEGFNIVLVDEEDVVVSGENVSLQDLQFDNVHSSVYLHDVNENLVAGTQYGVQVSAGNSKGYGPQCPVVYATPMSEPMAVPSSSITVVRHSTRPTSLVVSFAALTGEQNNGSDVQSYTFEWSTDPSFATAGTVASVTLDAGALSVIDDDEALIYTYEIEGLEPGTEYYVRIIALNEVGAGPPSSPTSALAPGTIPDPIEQNAFVLEVIHADHHVDDGGDSDVRGEHGVTVGESSTSLGASWPATIMTNDNGFPILGYVLEYFAATGASSAMQRIAIDIDLETLSSDETQRPNNYTLTKLTPGEAISARISARNALGYSPPITSVPDELAPPKQRPSEPLAVQLSHDSGQSLGVSFTAPESDGGDVITKYRIEYDPLPTFDSRDGSPLGFYQKLSSQCDSLPHLCEHTILGLTEGTDYHVRVFAGNSYGFGIPSLSTPKALAPMNPPRPPELVMIQQTASGTAIDVTFSPSASLSSSNITRYRIEWNAVDLYQPHTIQRIAITDDGNGDSIGGMFKLAYQGHYTKPLAPDSSAHQIKVAMENLATVGSVSVTRESLENGFAWRITFPGFIAMERVVIQSSSLTGSSVTATIDITVTAYDGLEIQSISCEGCLLSSNGFRLSYEGNATTELSSRATPKQMKDALERVGLGQVMVSRSTNKSVKGYEWRVTFLATLGDLSLLKPVYDPHQDIQIDVTEHAKGKLPRMDGDHYGSTMVLMNESADEDDDVDANSNEDDGRITHRIEKLQRGKPYHVQVSGYNEVGFGPSMYSTPSTVTL